MFGALGTVGLHARRQLKVNRNTLRSLSSTRDQLEEYWMPFTNNRGFKQNPKLFDRASGVYYYLKDGTELLDGMAGLWCVNAGHGQKRINEAIKAQLDKLDYGSCFNMGHPLPFEFAERLIKLLGLKSFDNGRVFFTMCGSTAVDSAIKIALAYHRANGNAGKIRFIGRERGYHGVGLGGMSVGGIVTNRKAFISASMSFVDHLPHTHSIANTAFSKGLPTWGAHLADELERLVTLHDASTIAAVIVEPVAGSTGVLPPPEGYLKRLREICTKHNILLIFDEVITGFGRVGAPFAANKFGVVPDMITCAKGLTNGVVPAGAVICSNGIYDTVLQATEREGPGSTIELFHGYTYSGHPVAMAAGIATLDVYRDQNLFQRADELAPYFQEAIHSLKGLPHVIDIRNCGLMGAVEVAAVPGLPTKRANDIFDRCFEKGVYVRAAGSTVVMSPPLVFEKAHVDRLVNALHESVVESAKHLS